MKLSEFKAWFEGYTENIEGAPSPEQWTRIKVRVSEVDCDPTWTGVIAAGGDRLPFDPVTGMYVAGKAEASS